MGYEVVSFSGGEPLLYHGLEEVLVHAKACGMRTTVTTNGTLLSMDRLGKLATCLDVLAISLDGPPIIHNEIRQSPHAFDHLLSGLENVRQIGLKFGFIHTLTRQSWEHLLWTAEFAAQQGASLLQLHPLEQTGRGGVLMPGDSPDDDILARVYLLTLALIQKYSSSMVIQLDVFNRDGLIEHPEWVYASNLDSQADALKPADLLGLLVVEANGSVVPISYGFSKTYEVCSLQSETLAQAWALYRRRGYVAFRELCRDVFKEIATSSDLPIFNWYELIVARSHGQTKFAPAQTETYSLRSS
jgi:MoaA/NifB/PqqE/SkfB family radical SAM enzyme